MIDEVGTIWVVEYPRPLSSGTYDILWHASVTDFLIRGLGGLRKEDIYGIYKSKSKAEKVAHRLMQLKSEGKMLGWETPTLGTKQNQLYR